MSIPDRVQRQPVLLACIAAYILAFLPYSLLPAVRTSTEWFLWWSSLHSALGLGLAFLLRNSSAFSIRVLAVLFLAPRLLALPMMPWLSDDVFRYLWDARLLLHGYNPYAHVPESPDVLHLRGELFNLVDYTHISTLYPPLAELLFGAAVAIGSVFTSSWVGGYIVWKLMLLAAEGFGVYMAYRALRLLGMHAGRLSLYLFMPLPVFECAGQAHIDGLLVAPIGALMYVCAALYSTAHNASDDVVKKRSFLLGILAAVLFLIKIVPAVAVLPFLRSRLRYGVFFGTAIAAVLALSVPFFLHPDALPQFLSVVRFYSNVSQFNGVALYTIMHALEFAGVKEWWLVAPSVLSAVRAVAVLACGVFARPRAPLEFARAVLLILTVATLLSGKVHIWYFVPLLLLNCMVGWWWLPLFAGASVLTYVIYLGHEWKEAYTLEYILWGAGLLAILAELCISRMRAPRRTV